ncbi:MAG TPA: translation initiation factor IF-5A [Candidatus Nanoarchaeia archaeon]|nr:translation initiation factor IF-5A [Candidatus Nanoarchaeia archaeon]
MAEKTVASIGSLKPGRYVIFEDKVCVLKSIETSRTGKHGHAKCRVEAIGVLDNSKIIKIIPAHDNVEVPIIEKKSAQVLSIQGDTANVMDMESYETFDLKIPDELKNDIKEGVQVMYWIILDNKVLKEVRSQ